MYARANAAERRYARRNFCSEERINFIGDARRLSNLDEQIICTKGKRLKSK